MTKTPRVFQIGKECVACGTCVPVCPKEAIQIRWGVSAHVDEENASAAGSVRMYALRRSSTWWKGAVHCEKHKEKEVVGLPLDRRAVLPVFGAVQYPVRMAGVCCFSVSRCSSPFSAAAKPTATATAGAASFSACWEKS